MEMIIYIGILGLVVSAMLVFAMTLSNNQNKAYSASEVEANAQIILSELTALIHSARSFDESISVWANDQGVLAVYTDNAQTASTTVSWDNGRVKVQNSTGAVYFLSSQSVSVPRLKFEKISADQLAVDLVVAYGLLGAELTPEKKYEHHVQTNITLR